MFDPKKLLDSFLGSQIPMAGGSVRDRAGQAVQIAKDNPLKATALGGLLLGTETGRDIGGTVLKVGGLAAVAGLAYTAYKQYQSGQQPDQPGQPNAAPAPVNAGTATATAQPELLAPPSDTGFHPSQMPQGEAEFSLALVRAMIAAARADGHIDDDERKRIAGRLSDAGIGSEAEQFVNEELARPVDVDALVAAAQTEEQRVELYTASRLAIEPETRAERGYLDQLAGRLNLPDALINHIERTVSAAKVPVGQPAPAGRPSPW